MKVGAKRYFQLFALLHYASGDWVFNSEWLKKTWVGTCGVCSAVAVLQGRAVCVWGWGAWNLVISVQFWLISCCSDEVVSKSSFTLHLVFVEVYRSGTRPHSHIIWWAGHTYIGVEDTPGSSGLQEPWKMSIAPSAKKTHLALNLLHTFNWSLRREILAPPHTYIGADDKEPCHFHRCQQTPQVLDDVTGGSWRCWGTRMSRSGGCQLAC